VRRRRLFSVGFLVAVLGMLAIQCGDDDPCDPDPCLERNALQGTCEWHPTPRHWRCECIEGAQWNIDSKECVGVEDACVVDRCRLIAHAVADTCVDEGGGDFSCDCDSGYVWEGTSNSCEEPCIPTREGPDWDPTCSDGLDNDCDGDVDLYDSDCTIFGGCTEPTVAATLDASPVYQPSDLGKHLSYVLLPLGVLIGLAILRRKR
jgi:hypothetical protein